MLAWWHLFWICQKIKLHVVFLVIASIIVGASVADYLRRIPDTASGFSNVAFMLIFLFRLHQYCKLNQQILAEDGEGI
ncbi:unnamed protein product [Rotaria magnacalcarata]